MQLIILKTGRYNDAFHRAHRVAAGETFETGADYGQSLIDAGLARGANTPDVAAETPDEALKDVDSPDGTPIPPDPDQSTDGEIVTTDPGLPADDVQDTVEPPSETPVKDPVSSLSFQLPGLSVTIIGALVKAGLLTADDVAAADDKTLIAVPGMTKTIVKQIRKALA